MKIRSFINNNYPHVLIKVQNGTWHCYFIYFKNTQQSVIVQSLETYVADMQALLREDFG